MRGLRTRHQKERDEFTAAALGDLGWLESSLKDTMGTITFDSNGLAPLHLAALHGRLDCLKMLIEKQKLDVNLPSTTGWRPIHLCVSNQTGDRAVQCLKYLLKNGADPSALNDDHVTPIHQAASEGHIQCLKILIECGAAIDSVDKRGHSPMDLAKLWGHRKCSRILATELWHQEKAGIANDMAQLRKDRMQEVVGDLEKQTNTDSVFYGQLAFNEWLDKHGIPPAKTGPSNTKIRPKTRSNETKKSADPRNRRTEKAEAIAQPSGMKPNSVAKKCTAVDASGDSKKTVPKQKPARPIISPNAKTVEVHKDDVSVEAPNVESYSIDTSSDINIPDFDSQAEIPEREYESWENPIAWNTSCKVKETFNEYQPKLLDAYPRDTLTMMPTKDASPHSLNIRHPKIFVTDEKDCVKRADEVLNVRDRMSQVDISVDLLPKDMDTFRPVLYNCSAVQDLPRRRAVTNMPTKLVCEGGMHLTDDVCSPLFKAGLIINSPSANSSKTSLSSY